MVAAIEAYQAQGVMACAKHFPGHGRTEVDSHKALPELQRNDAATETDLAPFVAAVAAGVGGVMTAHVMASVPGEIAEPASMSSFWIKDVLRLKIGFDGLVFSDAMEMAAIRDRWSPHRSWRKSAGGGDRHSSILYHRGTIAGGA